jgi:hypothetical protein
MNQSFLLKSVTQNVTNASHRKGMQQEVFQHVLLNSPHIKSPNFETLSPADLGLMFHVTDELFFEGLLSGFIERNFQKPLQFRLSTRMTTSGGTTTMSRYVGARKQECEFEIAIATTPLFNTFQVENVARVGGLRCSSRLEALQRILEHEMIHLAELLATDDSNCQGPQFRRWVLGYFGHRESNHQLLTPRDVARKQLGIRCGDTVTFQVDGRRRRGVVNRITKRATVLVPDPKGIPYTDGKSYSKFYVPLQLLKRA